MAKKSWTSIRNYLDHLTNLQPLPTEVETYWKKDPSIRACIFDIYGTLLISASGDIDQAVFNTRSLQAALQEGGLELNASDPKAEKDLMEEILEAFRYAINQEHDKLRQKGLSYPEVVIEDIWKSVFEGFHQQEKLFLKKNSDIRVFTFLFELMSNQVYPMPHLQGTLALLKKKGYPLGIISNAQFYTPVIMNYFLGNQFKETTHIKFIDEDLTVFSYQQGRSKPDLKLFKTMAGRLQQNHDISPEQTLYIGNDVYKDIYPASETGFKTVLFAGDKRSLRLRKDQKELNHVRPDHVIKDLRTLLEIVDEMVLDSNENY